MENKKFVIAIYVPGSLVKTSGGAFTYVEVLTDFLLNVSDEELSFVIVREGKEKVDNTNPDEIVIDYSKITYSLKQRAYFKLTSYIKFFKKSSRIQAIKKEKRTNYIINTLNKFNVDLLYYPDQHSALTKYFPFVINNWDLAHITVPPLPDTLIDLDVRENWYKEIAVRAISIFAESDTGKNELQNFLNIPENRIKVLPIFHGKVVNLKVLEDEQSIILQNLKLKSDNYFFYPAQFWALKNHYHLLEAISLLDFKNKNDFKVVFCGSDKKNMKHIKQVASDFNLQDRVVFLGFVTNEELYTLYKNSAALVFPSLLGPTNMPILEAMELDVPVLCSNLKGHKEMLPNFLGFFDPLNSNEISEVLERFIFDINYKESIKSQLLDIKKTTKFNFKNTCLLILDHFREIKKIRSLWD
jgi:glycosyltransferase involved in cell wall biosynthesis